MPVVIVPFTIPLPLTHQADPVDVLLSTLPSANVKAEAAVESTRMASNVPAGTVTDAVPTALNVQVVVDVPETSAEDESEKTVVCVQVSPGLMATGTVTPLLDLVLMVTVPSGPANEAPVAPPLFCSWRRPFWLQLQVSVQLTCGLLTAS